MGTENRPAGGQGVAGGGEAGEAVFYGHRREILETDGGGSRPEDVEGLSTSHTVTGKLYITQNSNARTYQYCLYCDKL